MDLWYHLLYQNKFFEKSLYKWYSQKVDVEDRLEKTEETTANMVQKLREYWNCPSLQESDFDYEQVHDLTHPHLSIKEVSNWIFTKDSCEFYGFMLYERAGSLKPEILTRAKEKHEYYRSCYKMTGKKNRKKLKKMPVDEEVWTPVTIDGVEYDIRVHPESRVPFVMVDGVPTPIPRDPDGKETIFP